MGTHIAVVADFDNKSRSHAATNDALRHSAGAIGADIEVTWVSTDELSNEDASVRLAGYAGLWIGPGSPYRSMDGALAAIRYGRENAVPLLGTCGGFQHIILEHARNVLGVVDADHEETSPNAQNLYIARLSCSLVGRTMTINVPRGSKLHSIYGRDTVEEEYLCNFGVNPNIEPTLREGTLEVVASDNEGAVRAVEMTNHPFFIGTLFLPQHQSTAVAPHPLITAFVSECERQNARRELRSAGFGSQS
jgi:CTP synthase (UTP-ammonia lyase)